MTSYMYCAILAVMFLIMTIYALKKRKLEFQYSFLWLIISIVLIILSLSKNIFESIAKFVGIVYAPAFLFLTGIVFALILIFYLMIVISDFKKRITRLTQEVGILKNKIEEEDKDNKKNSDA